MNAICSTSYFLPCIQCCFDSTCPWILFLLEIHTDPRAETLTAVQLLFSPGVEKPWLLYSVVSGHPSTFLLLWDIGIFGQDHKVWNAYVSSPSCEKINITQLPLFKWKMAEDTTFFFPTLLHSTCRFVVELLSHTAFATIFFVSKHSVNSALC